MDERGFEAEWPRRLYGHFKAAGLTEVGMEGHLAVREGDSLGTSLDAANFAQVRKEAVAKGLITDAEIDVVLSRLDAADFAVFSPVMFTAWGRRPYLAASQSDLLRVGDSKGVEQRTPSDNLALHHLGAVPTPSAY